jgi:hypothetical protein
MNIPDRSIEQTSEAALLAFRRFITEKPFSYYSLTNEYFRSLGMLRGIQRIVLLPRFYDLISRQIVELEDLYYQAQTPLADVGRSPAQSAEVVE